MSWKNLPIIIKRRVRQKVGRGFGGLRKSEMGFAAAGARDYQIGDPPRAVDLLRLIKFDEAIVIEKHPDRSAVVLFLVDISASERLGSRKNKLEAQLMLVRGLATACLAKNCPVLILAFASKVEFESKLIKGEGALLEALSDIEGSPAKKERTNPRGALERALELASRPSFPADLVFFVSDFLFENHCASELGALQDKADIVAVVAQDGIETGIPPVAGAFTLCDVETGEVFSAAALSRYNPLSTLTKLGIDFCVFDTAWNEESCYAALFEFFESGQ